MTVEDERTVRIEGWTGPWPDDDPDANFKRDVALYAHADPLSTLRTLSDAIDVPIGGLCHYVLAMWATAGSGGLLELGPTMTRRLAAVCDDAEFPDADRFDIDRTMDRHLGFGHGVHFCIGAHSARLEAIVILQELLARVPEYAVDESGIERLPSEFQIGDTAVPIEFAV